MSGPAPACFLLRWSSRFALRNRSEENTPGAGPTATLLVSLARMKKAERKKVSGRAIARPRVLNKGCALRKPLPAGGPCGILVGFSPARMIKG